MSVTARERLVVALDVGGCDAAQALVEKLGDDILWYKVGLELYTAAGPAAVAMLKERGKRVFLDLKLHDIPNTVMRAARQMVALGVDIIDLHIAAGQEAIQKTAAALKEVAGADAPPALLGVTVLTSAAHLGAGQEPLSPEALATEVARRALAGQRAGLDGVVCPASAAREVRRQCGEGFKLLIPGIRPRGSARGDQRWIATPEGAIGVGARWLVVGRPINAAPDPLAAAREILGEIDAAIPVT